MSFDTKCYELAEHFMPSKAPDRLKNALAQVIQDAVEEWLVSERDRRISELGLTDSALESLDG